MPPRAPAATRVDDGVLTIATGEPAFPPYVLNDETPEDGQGFEAAVAMAVALELGFDAEIVTWVRTAFDAAIAPGPKDFDFNLQQYTITAERAEVVDFSDGYYQRVAGHLRPRRLRLRQAPPRSTISRASRSASPPAPRASPTSKRSSHPTASC